MKEEYYISRYITKYELDIEMMIKDFKGYVLTIIQNNSKGALSKEDQEEIISDVFLSIWHNKKKIDNSKPLKNYIAGITKNIIRNKFKEIKNNNLNIELQEEQIEDTTNMDIIYEKEQINQAITEELNGMKKDEYEVFTKYYYCSKSIKEIAKELKLSEGNVKVKLHRIRKKLKKNLQKRGVTYKIISIILVLFMVTGVVFAKGIVNIAEKLIKNIFGNYNNGVTESLENGYVTDVNMEYVNSNDMKVKANQITLDDYNLGIVFDIEINKEEKLKDLFNINLKDFLITDENNNVLFAEYDNPNDFIKYCDENNLDKGKYGIGLANCAANGSILNKEGNKIAYSFYTTSEKFPKSKELYISFDKIYLLNNRVYDEVNNVEVDNRYECFNGNWKMKINLDEMQSNRNTTNYTVVNINDDKTQVKKAELSISNMRIEIITDSDKIDFSKLKDRENRSSINDIIPFNEDYIETSNGNKFYQSNSGNNGYDSLDNGKIRYYENFDYTFYDKTENIKIVLNTNKKEKIVIELKAEDT